MTRKQQDSTAKSTQEESPRTTHHKRNWLANHRRVRRFSITTHCGEVKIIPERYKLFSDKIDQNRKSSKRLVPDHYGRLIHFPHNVGINAVAQSLEENNSVSISTRVTRACGPRRPAGCQVSEMKFTEM